MQERLRKDFGGMFCDACDWEDLSPDELAALRGPGQKT